MTQGLLKNHLQPLKLVLGVSETLRDIILARVTGDQRLLNYETLGGSLVETEEVLHVMVIAKIHVFYGLNVGDVTAHEEVFIVDRRAEKLLVKKRTEATLAFHCPSILTC